MERRGRPKKVEDIHPSQSGKVIRKYKDWKYIYMNGRMIGSEAIDDPKSPLVKLEKLLRKLDKLEEPSYHPNGRKKRITKALKLELTKTKKTYDKLYKKTYG